MPFHRKRSRRRCWLGALLALAGLLGLPAAARAETEYDVKAAYLYKIATLVKWPAAAFPSAPAPLVIGVVGREAFSGFESVLRGQTIGARALEIRRLAASDAAGLRACHLVFVSDGERLAGIAAALQGRPVLLVGDASEFARSGGMIGFVVREQKLKLEINRDAAEQARLSISSDLLGIAKIVN